MAEGSGRPRKAAKPGGCCCVKCPPPQPPLAAPALLTWCQTASRGPTCKGQAGRRAGVATCSKVAKPRLVTTLAISSHLVCLCR